MTDQQQLVKITGLYENESAAGNRYFVGYCGPLKYLIFKAKEQVEGQPGWVLYVCQREERKPQEAPAGPAAKPSSYPEHKSARPRVKGPIDPAPFDDEIGF